MIVVEGPDGAGKTTLIGQLIEQTRLRVASRVVSKDAEAMVDLVDWTEQNVDRGFQRMIFDRHRLFSEPIYGPILRESLEPGFTDPRWFVDMLTAFYDDDPVVIYCLPPFEVVWSNVKNDPDNIVVQDRVTARSVWGAYYNKAATEYALRPRNVIMYDYTSQNSSVVLDSIIRTVRRRLAEEAEEARA